MIDAAILLAAGLGTRLAPLSSVRAKAALPVAGEPLIRRQIRWLAAAGVRRVVVNLHHLPASITRCLGAGADLGVEVRYSWEPVVLGSAGGPRRAFDLLGSERAFIVNGDTLTDLDLSGLTAAHDRWRPLATLAVVPRRRGYNAVAADGDGCLLGVVPADQADRSADVPGAARLGHFVGVQVAERRAFETVSPDAPSETLKWLYPRLLSRSPEAVRVWRTDASYHDIGTPAVYRETVGTFAAAEDRAFDRGPSTVVHPTADVRGTVLWDDVTVGARAVLHDCIVADGVSIPDDARFTRAAIVRRADAGAAAAGHGVGELWITPFDEANT